MKENCLWGRCKKKVKKSNNLAFSATHTYIKLTLFSFVLLFFMHLPLSEIEVQLGYRFVRLHFHLDELGSPTPNNIGFQ